MASGPTGLEHRVLERVGGFCAFLRGQGVPVGLAAEVDFARAAGALDVLDRRSWRDAASVTLAKTPEEADQVRAAFDAYFSGAGGGADRPRPGGEVRVLGRPRLPPAPPKPARVRAARETMPPIEVPLGTYSITAPLVPHSIRPVSEREQRALRRGARRFRRQVATLPGRRPARSHHGHVDLNETIRRGVHHGGEWLEIRRVRPRPTRASVVVLWDVSGSMREHESRFFGLVSALESISRSGRIFAFSTGVEEITAEVRRYGYRRATTQVGERIDRADGGTRIGHSLEEFEMRFGSILRESTTLVILSDGWDLGEGDLVAQLLSRIRARVARIVWVTPYTRRPGFEPRVGALEQALPYLDDLLGPEDFEARWPLRPIAR